MNVILEFFPGLREMENFHPLLVHFPIALMSCFLLLDAIAFIFKWRQGTKVANWFLWLGTLGALAAVSLGLQAALTVPHPDAVHEILDQHRNFGLNTTVLAVLLSIWRLFNQGNFSRLGHFVHLLAAVLMMLNMIRGADLGGLMVYRYGVAVQAAHIQSLGHAHGNVRHELREWIDHLLHSEHPHDHGRHSHNNFRY